LAKWIKIQGYRGVPMTYASIAEAAVDISGKQVGKVWPKRFCKRHPDLKMKKTTGLEKARAKALNQFSVNEFFDMLIDVIMSRLTPHSLLSRLYSNSVLALLTRS
jgi:hypothetical protein